MLTTFQNTLLGGAKVSSVATQEASEGLMQNAIKKDPSAIGFLSDYFALAKGVNAVALQRHRLQRRQRRVRRLPGLSDFYEVTQRQRPPARSRSSSTGSRHSPAAKKIIETNWIPLPTGRAGS